jgi:hypothetical protein
MGKRLTEVHTAGLFLYGGEDVGIETHDFLDEPLAVNAAQLRERCERLPAVHDADRVVLSVEPAEGLNSPQHVGLHFRPRCIDTLCYRGDDASERGSNRSLRSRMRSFLSGAAGRRQNGKAAALHSQNEGCQEPALRSGRDAPTSSGRRRRRAARRTRRSVSIAPPKAGRGTECARPELSVCGACAALRQGPVTRMDGDAGGDGSQLWRECAALGATRLGAGPKGTHQKVYRSKHRSNFWFRTARRT